MSISQRIARLERTAPEPSCPACGGKGPCDLRVITAGDPAPEPSVCPTCGRGPHIRVVIVKTYADDRQPQGASR